MNFEDNLISRPTVVEITGSDGRVSRIFAGGLRDEEDGMKVVGLNLTEGKSIGSFFIGKYPNVKIYDFNARVTSSAFWGLMKLFMEEAPEFLVTDYLANHPEIKAEANRARNYEGVSETLGSQEETLEK